MLPLQQVFPEAAAAPREEVTSSHLSLKVKINKFHFEEGEIQETPLVNILNAEEEADRHSGVHLPTLVVTRLDSTFEEEEDEMALNWGNRSLKDLMAARNKGITSQEVLKSQVPPTLPPPSPSLPTDLRLKTIPNLNKKSPTLKKGRWALKRGQNNRRWPKMLETRGPTLWTIEKSKPGPMCAFRNAPGFLG